MTRVEPSRSGPSTAGLLTGSLRGTTVGLVLAVSVIAFEVMAVNTAMPTAVRALDGLAYYGWPFTAFLLTFVLGVVLGGEFCDRRGPAGPMLAGLAVFAAGLVVAGSATGMAVLVLGRAVQGVGGGLVIVAIYVVIAEGYDSALRPRLFGVLSAAWVLPSLLGPLVAGALTEHASWRLVFLGIPPLIACATALIVPGLRRLPPREPTISTGPVRWPYAVLAAVGVGALQHAADRLDRWAVLVAALGLAAVVPAVRALLPAGTVRARPGLPAVVALRGVAAGAFFTVDALVPLTLSELHGYTPTAAGLPLLLGALGWAGASWWQGRHAEVSRAALIAVGLAGLAGAALLMATVSQPPVPGWVAYPAWCLGGAGMGLVMPSVGVLMLHFSAVSQRGRNTAALQISDVLTSAACIGAAGALVAAAERGAFGLSVAVGAVDLAMMAFALLGLALAGRVREDRDTAAGESASGSRMSDEW